MKAIVTGSNGLVGYAAAKALEEEGYKVHGIEEKTNSAEKKSPRRHTHN